MTNISDALLALTPTAEYTVRGTEIDWHSKDISQPSDDAIATKIDELKAAEPMRLLREERNRLIAATDWWASSDLTMSSAQTKYRQDLRDITKTATSLDDVSWPEVP
jgi:hypothetical protein|tara:strand:+ start:1319 stop:1639 length:321 start_codon:yes stop_codon:yes gene_type:complete